MSDGLNRHAPSAAAQKSHARKTHERRQERRRQTARPAPDPGTEQELERKGEDDTQRPGRSGTGRLRMEFPGRAPCGDFSVKYDSCESSPRQRGPARRSERQDRLSSPSVLAMPARLVESRIVSLLDEAGRGWIGRQPELGDLFDELRRFVSAGGKRLRPLVLLLGRRGRRRRRQQPRRPRRRRRPRAAPRLRSHPRRRDGRQRHPPRRSPPSTARFEATHRGRTAARRGAGASARASPCWPATSPSSTPTRCWTAAPPGPRRLAPAPQSS